ncbi:MAG: hypothetical protein IME93_06665 [Proteobacteria bacterium]|nr:hypothetical protein [Pseudomonadota bacterium]
MSSNNSNIGGSHTQISPDLRRRVEKLRNIGHFGGTISQHRALLTLPMRPGDLISAIIMAIVLFLIYLFALEYVFVAWSWILEWCTNLFNMKIEQGSFGFETGIIKVYTPYLKLGAATPTNMEWSVSVIITVITLIISFFLSERFIPVAYLLRALVFIQTISIIFFLFFSNYFPYSLASYHAVMMLAGLIFVGLVPLVYGLIYYIFDERLTKKIWLTTLTMFHLLLLIPLQYFAHAYLIHKFSLMYMPILFLMFGLMIDVFVLIAFYSWGMSWEGAHPPHVKQQTKKSKVEEFAQATNKQSKKQEVTPDIAT